MGGSNSKYTMEQLESEVPAFTDKLPRLQLSNFGPNVMELQGSGWFFNAKAPFDTSILRGKLSPEQYVSAVESINKAHCERLVGLSRAYKKSDIPVRRQLGKEAVEATIAILNKETSGFRWDIQAGASTSTITDIKHGRLTSTEHKQETSLLLVFDQE
ncbi:expressed unknown protein [Seminavis robusta]|uniref:Uncharacterized protein n=1 Tax=Seminavis robusta TaxID=568900 RepID=A0A9N8F135_9STRA|nr:expressed unknown protein [Seminavis robusta]|eukprot:Sro2453_g328170.1 n/a (158) ;mRNA; r:5998-6471